MISDANTNRLRSWRMRSRQRTQHALFERTAPAIRAEELQAASLRDAELLSASQSLREQVAEDGDSESTRVKFTGLVAAAIYRTHGFRLFDVQLAAIAAGAEGHIVEMQTGEGKTVVTGAIAAVKTLTAPSVHVGTTNTYLAERDLQGLQPTFEMLGITCGLLPEQNNENQSRRVYRQQVVYGPGYQFGFDFLRDEMVRTSSAAKAVGSNIVNRIRGNDPLRNLIQSRSHDVALIDEADSVMIDEAMTPLVISLPSNKFEDPTPYLLAKKFASSLVQEADYKLELPSKKITVNDQANQRAHEFVAGHRNLQLARPWRIYILNALRATRVFHRDVDYVVVDSKVQIVDQFTGRILPDRTWQDGLHQAVEAKENLPIQPGRESTTQITRQRYLQLYDQLAGLTGTARVVADEFRIVYGCHVVEVPTNKRCIRRVMPTRFFASHESKLDAIATEVATRHQTGQPILVGTKTIRESHDVRDALVARGLNPVVLNGVQDEAEAEIVTRAGCAGSISIATNMAGRGTDIKPDAQALAAGGLHVIGVSPNESKRIDRQLVGRAARQGQPGSAQFFASATDTLFLENNASLAKQIERRAKSNGESADFSRQLAQLQEKIEARAFSQRQAMILRDRWMDTVREAIEK